MLIDFTVGNWKSFARPTTFNLVASLERKHRDTLSSLDGFRSRKIVPVAAVYGGNASGKTGLFKALTFLRDYVLRGTGVGESIPVEPFRLDDRSASHPTSFDITFLMDGTVYRLQADMSHNQVLFECLTRIGRNGDEEHVIYRRDRDGIKLDEGYFDAPERVQFVADGTLENRLFLTNAAMQNVAELLVPYAWFRDVLTMVDVSSQIAGPPLVFYTKRDFVEYASRWLAGLDTGIEELVGEDVDMGVIPVPPDVVQRVQAEAMSSTDMAAVLTAGPSQDYPVEIFVITAEGGRARAQRLRTRHLDSHGHLVTFTLQMESSGSRRLLNLMPMLFELFNDERTSARVYVVDELDRSFHTMLTARLVELFLDSAGPTSRRQLLFTTHDLLLMDQRLFRRDELFLMERDMTGRSELMRLDEFEGVRADTDLVRAYLDGRFGGVPMFGSLSPVDEGDKVNDRE